jgi:hypothetical protein
LLLLLYWFVVVVVVGAFGCHKNELKWGWAACSNRGVLSSNQHIFAVGFGLM